MRKEVNAIVRKFVINSNGSVGYEKAWNSLYRLYNKVCHQYIKSRARRRNLKPIEVIEMDGNIEILKILAENLFVA